MIRASIAALLLVVLAGCSSTPAGPDQGLGSHDWKAPSGVSDVLTDKSGHVTSYEVTMPPQSLASALALVLRQLPSNTAAAAPQLVVGDEATKCEIVDLTSPTLGRTLGSPHAMAIFQTDAAVTMDTNAITHALVASSVSGLPRAC